MVESHKVAVIGAGVAGLMVSRELRNEVHRVVIFEKSDKLGGLWVYDLRVESDELGRDPTRENIHSSVYRSLRTNVPRVLMSFSGFPFADREYGDPRRFPGHEEVLGYLNDFAARYGIAEVTRFNSEMFLMLWSFVTVHCTVPRIADIPGIEKWPGKQTHSHNYRVPEQFTNQVVVVIGNGASAYYISRDISKAAKAVHVSSRSPEAKFSKLDHYHNLWQHSSIRDAKEDGTVEFEDGTSVQASIIMHCSGYKHGFPFLNTNGIVNIDDNRVGLLYKHVFPPDLAPWLSFVGLPQKTLIFDMMELQSKWIARVLSGKRPKHLTHHLENSEEYLDYLAAEAGVSALEDWRKEIFREILKRIVNHIDGLRDE
ncbi:hypothetical protein RND81_02G112000 [Saponaria officinalis]|uniref:Flavin-containing monooxygenase n=1 Tax=Saponaria officinalis TaxID=3572 RepID=A0AAW1MM53_SAPOF